MDFGGRGSLMRDPLLKSLSSKVLETSFRLGASLEGGLHAGISAGDRLGVSFSGSFGCQAETHAALDCKRRTNSASGILEDVNDAADHIRARRNLFEEGC